MNLGYLTACRFCGSDEGLLLHTVHHQSHYRRLCTDCVLKNHRGLFCSTCLAFFPEPLLSGDSVTCLRCPSVSHRSCLRSNAPPSYCASCSNPSLSFFNRIAIDVRSAKALVAAGRIAVASMSKAAERARVEAEKRVGESVLANRKAAEAMELVRVLREVEIRKWSESKRVAEENGGGGGTAVVEKIVKAKAFDPTCARFEQIRNNVVPVSELKGVTEKNRVGVALEEKKVKAKAVDPTHSQFEQIRNNVPPKDVVIGNHVAAVNESKGVTEKNCVGIASAEKKVIAKAVDPTYARYEQIRNNVSPNDVVIGNNVTPVSESKRDTEKNRVGIALAETKVKAKDVDPTHARFEQIRNNVPPNDVVIGNNLAPVRELERDTEKNRVGIASAEKKVKAKAVDPTLPRFEQIRNNVPPKDVVIGNNVAPVSESKRVTEKNRVGVTLAEKKVKAKPVDPKYARWAQMRNNVFLNDGELRRNVAHNDADDAVYTEVDVDEILDMLN